jgi:hypothetical protein
MRVFTAGTAGLLSDLSAREVADSLRDQHGLDLDVDVVDARLSYLVNHGNRRAARARPRPGASGSTSPPAPATS